jgi:hypothetical protein
MLAKIHQDQQYGLCRSQDVMHKNLRALVRLLCLHDTGMIEESQWEEVLALKTNMENSSDDLDDWAAYLVDAVEDFKITKLNLSVVKQLIFAVSGKKQKGGGGRL